jgi:hypothetical protein
MSSCLLLTNPPPAGEKTHAKITPPGRALIQSRERFFPERDDFRFFNFSENQTPYLKLTYYQKTLDSAGTTEYHFVHMHKLVEYRYVSEM